MWGYLRHYINLKILYSILTEFATVGPYELNWETQQYKCWISQAITFALLAALQAVNLFWWFLICRIAYRFVVANEMDDDRSDYDDSEPEEVDDKAEKENGKSTATPNGTPKVLVNGEPPVTPERELQAVDHGSIASRVRERKKNQK